MLRRILFATICLVGCGPVLRAQEGGGGYRLRVDSHLVETNVLVRDSQGNLVTRLPQEAFHITEDGAEQQIRYFASRRELPLSVGILVDASGSQETFVKTHEKEIRLFLKSILEPRDKVFALCFGNHLRLTSDWTSDPDAVLDGIRRFNKGDRDFPELAVLPQGDERELGTALYDAIYTGVEEKLSTETGRRKVLVVFSDGEENSSEHDLLDAIEAAQNANVLVYSLRSAELHHGSLNARSRYGQRALNHLADETGGSSFDVQSTKVEADFASIAADLQSIYELGYYSTNKVRDRRFRKVTIQVEGEGYRVRARSGYTPR
ncbi:MAG: VWA domain-containing protein [Acidobacteriaceae bacterium]|nr:VWA domain-containing protein [Acidobacteriaceae bacterium]